MRFSCDRDLIIKEFQIAQEIISSRNAMSILSYVLLQVDQGSLLIRATDLKVSFESRIPVDSAESGSTAVFCDKVIGILRSLPPGEVLFELLEDEKFVIRPVFKQSIDFRLRNMRVEQFPETQWADPVLFFELPQKHLIDMINHTVFAVSDDETRYYMNGVYLEKREQSLVMVATDGRRLSFVGKDCEGNIPEFSPAIVPPKVLNLLRKLVSGEGSLKLAVTEKHIFIEFGGQKISSQLIDGQFPNYQRVIPEKQEQQAIINREEFLDSLKRVGQMVEKSRRIYLDLYEDTAVLQSEESELGVAKEEFGCSYQGPKARIALNLQYVEQPLRVIESEEIQIQFTETTRAISIYAVPEADYFHIVMPMQAD